MKPSPACADRQEALVALVLGELEAAEVQELEAHLAGCAACRQARRRLEAEEGEVQASFARMTQALELLPEVAWDAVPEEPLASPTGRDVSNPGLVKRVQTMTMRYKRLVMATVAAALAAGVLLLLSTERSVRTAYALEQTVLANQQVTSIHVKVTPRQGVPAEAWLECNAQGEPLRLRLDFPITEEGPKVIVVTGEQADVWFAKKHAHVIVREPKALQDFMKQRELFDPRFVIEELREAERVGKVQVTTENPGTPGEPIVLTAVNPQLPEVKTVFQVDPQTKLVTRVEELHCRDNRWTSASAIEYLDYNRPINLEVFQYQLPGDVVTADFINQPWGLPQGDLSDQEIAKKVARELIEALIAKDFAKAALLFEGANAEWLQRKDKENVGHYVRIIEVGEPFPDAPSHSLRVPMQVELEGNGNTEIQEIKPYVRRTLNDQTRWAVHGGL